MVIEFEGAMLMAIEIIPFEPALAGPGLGEAALLVAGSMARTDPNPGLVLQDVPVEASDEWLLPLLSTSSSDALAAGIGHAGDDVLLNPQSIDGEEGEEEEIIITGRRPRDPDYEHDDDGTAPDPGTGTAGGGGGSSSTPVAAHDRIAEPKTAPPSKPPSM